MKGLAAWLRAHRPRAGVEWLVLLCSLYFAVVSNTAFWSAFHASAAAKAPGAWALGLGLFLAITALHAALLLVLVNRWSKDVVLPLLLLVTAAAAFYMQRYHVYIDTDMVVNVLATERKEAGELITPGLLLALLLHGLVPSLLVWWWKPAPRPLRRGFVAHALGIALALGVAAAAIGFNFQSMASLMRNEKALRHLVTPGNWMVALAKALHQGGTGPAVRAPIAPDARRERPEGTRPRVLLLVVGETVRAANWGLNGYARQTTPRLAALEGINYPEVEACGTNTEVSVPCLFSEQGLRHYDRNLVKGSESLLHLLHRLGIEILWRDNQTGCKGVCDGLPFESFLHADLPEYCDGSRCLDGVLLHGLQSRIEAMEGDAVVVLHMLGNHGPAYHARYPEAFRRFTPACERNELGECSREEITNAYDNAILYTDAVLADAVALLETLSTTRDTALLYVSDHGESLGEAGLYLHGVPRIVAPEAQTRVPLWLWLSPSLREAEGLDLACLRREAAKPRSHDAVFSTVLDLMHVESAVLDPAQDLLGACRARVSARPADSGRGSGTSS
ncbi:MAG: phosphoethanolamine transferase [Silanimonas lenta]